MRTAVGASRYRILRQLLTENILLGLLGAIGGLGFAWIFLHVMDAFMPPRVARFIAGWSNVSLNGRALAFSFLLAIGAGIVAGLLPALEALRVNVVEQLKSASRASIGSAPTRRLRNVFAVSQIALAVALVIGGTLISKGMNHLLHLADVYQPDKILTFSVTLPANRYDTPQKQAAWYRDSLQALRALPGVSRAEVTNALPYSDSEWVQDCDIENRPTVPGKFQTAARLPISDGYFAAFGIPILSGRGFSRSDSLGTQPVAVVSRRFVARYFPNENPLGHRIRIGAHDTQTPWLTIVGVAEEANYSLWEETVQPAIYMSAAQIPASGATYAIATTGDPLALAAPARKALAALDPTLPLDTVETYHELLHDSLIGLMYAATMLVIDAIIALLLAAIGIFGVMANLVGERTREIGLRLAMGARREDVLGMILSRASWLTGTGLFVGLLMAFGLARLVANLLRGVRPDDPVVFVGIACVIALIAMAASWIPARRASRIDPMAALRNE
jgi:putative ABC transport system permease protein